MPLRNLLEDIPQCWGASHELFWSHVGNRVDDTKVVLVLGGLFPQITLQ